MNQEPIRILHIVRYLEQGGIQNLIMNIYRKIDRNRIQFDFLVSGEGFFDSEVKNMGGKIYTIPYITDLGVRKYQKKLKEFFDKHKEYKIVHSHLNQLAGVPLETAKEVGIPCRIAHAHTTKNTNNLLGKIYKLFLQRKINKNATILLACSKESAEWIYRERMNEAIIIKNGIDIEKFTYNEDERIRQRKALKIDSEEIVIGHVGRFSDVKNHSYLIDIFKELNDINKNTTLILIGDGKNKNEIEEKVKKYNLQNKTFFLGNVNEIYKYYQIMDIFIFPSIYEGLPLTLIEAQTNGLPIIASDTITKDVNITNTIKYFSIRNNPRKWALKILETEYKRRNNIKLIIKNDFNINSTVLKLEKIYNEAFVRGN